MYNKYLASEHNELNIQPIEPEKIYHYYLGVFNIIKNAGVNIGYDECVNLFDEMLKLTVDVHYDDVNLNEIKLFNKILLEYKLDKNI